MNWLFGTKRKQSSPEVYVSEETVESFSVVDRKPSYESPLPPYPIAPRFDGSGQYPYVAPYPPAPSQFVNSPTHYTPTPYPPNSTPYNKPVGNESTNPLDSIPFVLAPSLMAARSPSSPEIDSIKSQMSQLRSRLQTKYLYDFSLERSVIEEHSVGI